MEKVVEIGILPKKDPVPLDLLIRSNLVQQELSRMNINSLSLLDKTLQVAYEAMSLMGRLLEKEVIRKDPEWAAAMASLAISEKKVRIKPFTMMHLDFYADYLRKAEPNTESRAGRALLATGGPRTRKLHGRVVEVHGPYQVLLNVD